MSKPKRPPFPVALKRGAVTQFTAISPARTASKPWGGRRSRTDVPVEAESRLLLDDRPPGGSSLVPAGPTVAHGRSYGV